MKKVSQASLISTVLLSVSLFTSDVQAQAAVTEPTVQASTSESVNTSGQQTVLEKNSQATFKDASLNRVNRISGDNRYKNAVEISQAAYQTADTVYLTERDQEAHALVATPLAFSDHAPLLLTRQDAVPNPTVAEIDRLNAKKVVILGNEATVSKQAEDQLTAKGIEVKRFDAADPYDMAAQVAVEQFNQTPDKKRDVFLASGEVLSDALSISKVAAEKKMPILLTPSNRLHDSVRSLKSFINKVTIIGGTSTISQAVEQELKNLGIYGGRIAGKNRYEVNRNILNKYGSSRKHYYVVSGEAFSDVLPASLLVAKKGSGLLLIKNNNRINNNQQLTFAINKGIHDYTFIGGPVTLSQSTQNYFKQAHKSYEPSKASKTVVLMLDTDFPPFSSDPNYTFGNNKPSDYTNKHLTASKKAVVNGKTYYYLSYQGKNLGWMSSEYLAEPHPIMDEVRKWLGTTKWSDKHKHIIDTYNSVKPLPVGYPVKYKDDWCDAFVSFIGIQTGQTRAIGRECGVDRHLKILKSKGAWLGKTSQPKPGDIIIFDWNQNGFQDHIGFVEKVENGIVHTIEGNTRPNGDKKQPLQVARRQRKQNSNTITGYARPAYKF